MKTEERTKARARDCESDDRIDELIRNVRMESARRHAAGEIRAQDDMRDASQCRKYKVF